MFLRIVVGLLVVIGLGGLATALIMSLGTPPAVVVTAAAPLPPAPGHILVASRAVRAGSLLVIEDLAPLDVVAGQEPANSFRDTIADRDRLRGAMVRRTLNEKEPILVADVLRPGDRGFLAAILRTGMRAVTVGVDPVSGTAGLIWPGDRVDLVLTQASDEKEQPVDRRVFSETVLTDLRVIAVDQQLVQGGQAAAPNTNSTAVTNRTVTLEASPFDAQRVTTAARLGRLSLVVRSADGDGSPRDAAGPKQAAGVKLAAVTTAEVLPDAGAAAPMASGVPIAWGGDVSPALRERPGTRPGTMMRVFSGPKPAEEVKF